MSYFFYVVISWRDGKLIKTRKRFFSLNSNFTLLKVVADLMQT